MISKDINMTFGLENCASICLKRGRVQNKTHTGNTFEKDIKELDPWKAYKYLGIEESYDIQHKNEKEKLKKEYLRSLRIVLGTELSAKNKIQASGTLAVTVLRYSCGNVKWHQAELQKLDRKTGKLLWDTVAVLIMTTTVSGKETCDDISKYRPISLINTAAKVLEKLLINRIMYHMYSNNVMNNNQYGFTSQTNKVDDVMALKDFVYDGLTDGQYIALISLDVKGAFDAAWWPSILNSLMKLKCPKNLYNLCESQFNKTSATLVLNSSI